MEAAIGVPTYQQHRGFLLPFCLKQAVPLKNGYNYKSVDPMLGSILKGLPPIEDFF